MSAQLKPDWVDKYAAAIAEIMAAYPVKRSALLPLLHLAQGERGHLVTADYVAIGELIGESAAYVESTASFYSMFHRHPVGKHHIVVCGNLGCALRGAEQLIKTLEQTLGITAGQVTPDGLISLEVTGECLAACDVAPVLQVGVEYFVRMTPERGVALVEALRKGDAEAVAALAEHPAAGRALVTGNEPYPTGANVLVDRSTGRPVAPGSEGS